MVTTKINYVNCSKMARLLDVNRHRAGFILKWLAEKTQIIKHYSTVHIKNYEVIDHNKFIEYLDKLRDGEMDAELVKFKHEVIGYSEAG